MKESFQENLHSKKSEENNLSEFPDKTFEIPLVLNKEGKEVGSDQFKKLLEVTDYEQALKIYKNIKEIENGEFKDSKLRDENNEILIVWHGSPRKFDEFETDVKGEFRWRNEGLHFNSSRELIKQYSEKAYKALNIILYDIALEIFGLKSGVKLNEEQEQKAYGEYNKMVEDIIENRENSVFYNKAYEYDDNQKKFSDKRKSDFDCLKYGKHLFGLDWALEIFNGEMPTKENTYFDEVNGLYFGNDIEKYEYAAVLNIENPFREETVGIDYGFEKGEKAHKEKGTDGTILFHKENIIGDGQLEVVGSKNTTSVAVFDKRQIKLIGRVERGKFIVNE